MLRLNRYTMAGQIFEWLFLLVPEGNLSMIFEYAHGQCYVCFSWTDIDRSIKLDVMTLLDGINQMKLSSKDIAISFSHIMHQQAEKWYKSKGRKYDSN